MSTSPYSIDLRKKVIEYLEQGNTQVSASKIFGLNLSTVNRWYLRYKREGDVRARKRLGAKIKMDIEGLKNYILSNPDAKIMDMSRQFKVSKWSIGHWLKRLGFSYKKILQLYESK